MAVADWGVVVLALLVLLALSGLLGLAGFWHRRRRRKLKHDSVAATEALPAADKNLYKISYVPSDMEWSGSFSGVMPLKTLTYKQYECLEDARYGFKITGVTPTERKNTQPHRTRAHGQKTVASLARHGFLVSDGFDGYAITDHGLNALEVCDVRY